MSDNLNYGVLVGMDELPSPAEEGGIGGIERGMIYQGYMLG